MAKSDLPKAASQLKRWLKVRSGHVLWLFAGIVLGVALGAARCSGPAKETHHAGEDLASAEQTVWTCSMHPQIRQHEPGQCPICGMDLIPVSTATAGSSDANSGRVMLSDRARALARLTTTAVHRQSDAVAELRLLGRVEPNETTQKTVTAWTGGRIDRLQVNATGERIRAGQVLATLYSPEVYTAHQDLLVAKRQVARLQDSPEATQQAASSALEAARERLRLLGVPDDALARMESEERPTRAVQIRTPFSGTVIERLASEGSYVSTGTPLYRIANLNTLWVQLDAYENDLSRISLGQSVRISVDALPGEVFEGKITFVEPTLDTSRRTAQVRVQVDNRDGRLRPGMFAEATVAAAEPEGEPSPLVVPATTPLFTGRRALVYVEVETGDRVAYEPRSVRLGPRLGDVYPVVAGLSEGERVVTRGAFALDADLQIRGGPSMMASSDDSQAGAWDDVIHLAPAERQLLSPVVAAYLDVQGALADDDLPKAKTAAAALARAAGLVELKRLREAEKAWAELATALKGHGQHISSAENLEQAREGFEPLSKALIALLTRFGNPLDRSVHLAYCPMASGSDGALWVQEPAEIDNSYFGASMLTCGEIRQEVTPGGYLSLPPTVSPSPNAAAPGGHVH